MSIRIFKKILTTGTKFPHIHFITGFLLRIKFRSWSETRLPTSVDPKFCLVILLLCLYCECILLCLQSCHSLFSLDGPRTVWWGPSSLQIEAFFLSQADAGDFAVSHDYRELRTPGTPSGELRTPDNPSGELRTPGTPSGELRTPDTPSGELCTRGLLWCAQKIPFW